MALKLADIVDWKDGLSCSPTALCAISGKTPTEIGVLLQQIAGEQGRKIDIERNDYAIGDWLQAVKRLGGDWTPGDDFRSVEFQKRPTINEWMSRNSMPDLELVVPDDGAQIGHVFAGYQGRVVDTYTGGKLMKFSAVPKDYEPFRVSLTFIV
jgi:hypothetical protein